MAVFAIGDLHLPGGDDKPMNVFGPHWDGHFERIQADWRSKVRPEDTVLIPGDISWAMQTKDALPDLLAIGALPGKKILLRGNHDYWWCGITRLREMFPPGMYAVQNDALLLDGIAFCGTRGWFYEEETGLEHDAKIMRREILRLEASLNAAGERETLVFLHYPPIYQKYECPEILELLEKHRVRLCCYGHIHGKGISAAFNGWRGCTEFRLVSADAVDFAPVKLLD